MHHLIRGFGEVRLVFDRYFQNSLKSRTREKRTSGQGIQYQISANMDISNIPVKQFLSHINTKQELTVFLSGMAKDFFLENGIPYVITYDTLSESNIQDCELTNHDHEEADTLLILQANDVAKTDPFKECVVYSPDTDVFLLLIHFYQSLPQVTEIQDKYPFISVLKSVNIQQVNIFYTFFLF